MGPALAADVSLANDADLYVGGTPQGHYLNGAIDFLRIARGTLADSKTTIEELYAWEFNGPFLYDFTGRERPADGGCAGAIDEVAVGQVRAATYVVDQAAPGAADTNPGTEEKPFKTVQHAADVAKPGDTVYVMAGKYDERVKVKASGAEGQPITFVAMPRRSATVGGFDLEASYIRVEGFEITADKPATAVQLRGSHCEVLDNYIHDMMAAVSGTVGKPSADGNTRDYSAVAHNRIAYNKVYHCEYGFILGGEDWLVENNEVSRLFMYAPGNKNDDCDYSRFFGKGCIQRYNYYHGSTRQEIKTAHVDCLQTFTNNGEIAMDLLFEYNTCFDFHQMCMVESAPHIGSVRGWTFRRNIVSRQFADDARGLGPGHHPDARRDDRELHHLDGELGHHRPAGQGIDRRADPQQHPLRRRAGRRRPHGLLPGQPGDRVQPDVQDRAAGGRDEHQRQGPALRGSARSGTSACRRAARPSARARAA